MVNGITAEQIAAALRQRADDMTARADLLRVPDPEMSKAECDYLDLLAREFRRLADLIGAL